MLHQNLVRANFLKILSCPILTLSIVLSFYKIKIFKMNEFLLIFRRDFKMSELQPSPEQLQKMMKGWQNWMGSIAAQNKLVSSGNRLADDGKVVKPGAVVTNGPYVEIKELIGGYIMISAESLEEAAEISKGCPILNVGGSVEVRAIVPMEM
jgi:hypothetical protein